MAKKKKGVAEKAIKAAEDFIKPKAKKTAGELAQEELQRKRDEVYTVVKGNHKK